MKLSLVSYDGNNINDGTNYRAFISGSIAVQGDAKIIELSRVGRRPVYANKVLNSRDIPITIHMLGTVYTQIDSLNTIFDVEEMDPKVLIVKDTNNSDKQWYVYATVKAVPKVNSRILTVILSASDPVWREVSATTDIWSITASDQTHVIAVAGNVPAKPTYKIKPTSSGTGRFQYQRLAMFRNRTTMTLENYPLKIIEDWDTAALVADATRYVLINDVAGIDADDETIPYDGEVGTFPTSGTAYVGTEQISYTGKTATNLTGVTRGINDTTAAAHADDVEIYASKVMANGNDVRVYVDGVETNRWLSGMNTATTQLWINLSMAPKQDGNLRAAMGSGDTVTVLNLRKNKTNLAVMKKLPAEGEVLIDSELFSYTAKRVNAYQLTGVTRAIKGSAAADHAIYATVSWIQHEIYIFYGSPGMDAPDTETEYEPVLNMATSTNDSWVYDEFGADDFKRTGAFRPNVARTVNKIDVDNQTTYYTGARLADADPATEMGMVGKAWQSNSVWKADTINVNWYLYQPCYVTHVTATGEKYRASTAFPLARLLKSKNNKTWAAAWTDLTPSAAETWENLAEHAAVAMGSGYRYLQFVLSGTVAASASNYVGYSIKGLTLTLNSSYTPTGIVQDVESPYYMDALISNNTTSEYMTVNANMLFNQTLVIDTLNKRAYILENNVIVKTVKLSSVRRDWLNLNAGNNTLQFTDAGTGNITFTTVFEARNT